ncbi:MAG: putative MscS family protein [bacterium]|nr:MAG: putative MscS family protein [bacterium]
MAGFEYVMSISIAGIPVKLMILSFVILLTTFVLRRYIVKRALGALHLVAKRTTTGWDEEIIKAIKPPISLGVTVTGVWLAVLVLPLPKVPYDLHDLAYQSGTIVVLFILSWLLIRIITATEKFLREKAADPKHWLDTSLVPLIVLSLKTLVWITIFIVVAQNLGYSVSGLIASLGIGGIAVALAAQGTLANFFASVMVMIDKPFRIGDWIKSPDFEGVVEEIGFRSTKIRTFGKTVEVVPNDKIANMIVENMDRRKDKGLDVRRVKMTIGLEYSASADQMEEAVKSIKEILSSSEKVDQEFFLVNFTDFGDSSLNILVYFFANTADWEKYLEIRQNINLAIMRKLEEMGLSIAFPTRTIHIEKSSEEKTITG